MTPTGTTEDCAIDRSTVHRSSSGSVLPTGFINNGADFAITLRRPSDQVFAGDRFDSLFLAEMIRQSTIMICHLGYGVAPTQRFIMLGLGFEMTSPQRLSTRLKARAWAESPRFAADGQLRSTRIRFEFNDEQGSLASGYGDARIVDSSTYRRIRGAHADAQPPSGRPASNIRASQMGRRSEIDVVIRQVGDEIALDVDGRHPFYFDHPLDHVPGVAVIEAFRQSVAALTRCPTAEFETFEAVYSRTVEFDTDALLDVRIRPGTRDVEFMIVQDGRHAVRASAKLQASPSADISEDPVRLIDELDSAVGV
ncbi:AfsA-related hotdog domain-containing protein [Microbacterium sp. NPDC058269]|uniref:AfsA-related hotdog domain-containing protein n=1 Tax=Microbacterium sp. NPDC058269 TaxID=3346414 RepID=UPI0036DBCCE0